MATLNATAATDSNADQSLPDASPRARWILAGLLVLAAAIAVVMNAAGWTGKPFVPPRGDANFSLFAGFYAAAQIIERVMELIVPLFPITVLDRARRVDPRADARVDARADDAARVAQVKADRAKIALGVAAVMGVAASCGFGLFFLRTLGIEAPSNTIDALCTGVLIAAGTKPLHDFITTLQNTNTPRTGTTAS